MNVALPDVAALWETRLRDLQQAEEAEEAANSLLQYLHGRPLSVAQQKALQSLSPTTRSLLAFRVGPNLAKEAEQLIRSDTGKLYTSNQSRNDVIDCIARISGVYRRWQEGLDHLGR